MLKKYRKPLLNALFFVLVFGLTVWAVFYGADLKQTLFYLREAAPLWLLTGVGCVLIYILSESVMLWYLMRRLGTRVSLGRCCLYSFIGFFYCAITPSASGGQPMQVLAMHKDRIPAAVSTVVLAIVTILYKLVLVLLGLAVVLLRPRSLMPYLAPVEGFLYLGLSLNVVFIALLLLLVFSPAAVRKLARGCFRLIHRIRPFRDEESQAARLEAIISQYDGTAAFYKSNPGIILRIFLITLAQRLILFLVTWLTYRSLGLSGESVFTLVMLQAMISVAVDMMPLPGGMGISESLFLIVFLPVFGEAMVLPGMILSRGISYYSQLLISAAMTLVAHFILKKPRR